MATGQARIHTKAQVDLGQQLRAVRLTQQRTQEEIAVRSGVSLRALQQLEGGAGSTLTTFLQVLEALGKLPILKTLAPAVGDGAAQQPAMRAPKRRTIRIADYPQLKLIAWNRRADATLDEKEALALYERNWRHVDTDALEPKERTLIDRLAKTIGKGVLHV